MPRGDRGFYITIVGWIAFAIFILWDSQQQIKPAIYCPKGGTPSECRPEQYLTERAGISSTVERAISNPEPATGQDHEKRDLAAQEASAVFAFWMALFAGLGTAVTTIGTIFLYQQIRLTREAVQDTGHATDAMFEANEIARESLSGERPWIKIESAKITNVAFHDRSDQPEHDDFFSARIEVKVVNVGSKPAMQVQLMPRLWLNEQSENRLEQWQVHWFAALNEGLQKVNESTPFGRIVFPTDQTTFLHIPNTGGELAGTLKVRRDHPTHVRIFLTFIVFYKSSAPGWHYTLTNSYFAAGKIGDWILNSDRVGDKLSIALLNGADLAT